MHITYELSLYKQIQTENPTPLIGVERGGGGPTAQRSLRPPAGLPVSRAQQAFFLLFPYPYPTKKSEVLSFATGLLNFLSFSYHYPSEKSEVLSFATGLLRLLILIIPSFPKVRSTRLCSQALLLSYPLGLCASFAAGPSPRLVRGTCGAFGRPSSSVRGTMCAIDRGQVVQSEVLYMPLDQCQSVRSEVLVCSRMSVKLSIP